MLVNYAGVDWLTMTTKKDSVGGRWFEIYTQYREKRLAQTDREQPFSNGFYTGLGIASMRWGYSENIGYIMIVSGEDAELLWQRLQPAKHKVTRVDLCFDFTLEEPTALAKETYAELVQMKEEANRKYSYFENSYGGATCYVGSRQSMQYGRLYDKGVQAKTHEKGMKWRAEVEYKKPLSGSICDALADVPPGRRGDIIIATVKEWYAKRGVTFMGRMGFENAIVVSVEQRITTARKKLAWLRKQVAPSVTELVEAGYGQEVLQCLLLDERTIDEINFRRF